MEKKRKEMRKPKVFNSTKSDLRFVVWLDRQNTQKSLFFVFVLPTLLVHFRIILKIKIENKIMFSQLF